MTCHRFQSSENSTVCMSMCARMQLLILEWGFHVTFPPETNEADFRIIFHFHIADFPVIRAILLFCIAEFLFSWFETWYRDATLTRAGTSDSSSENPWNFLNIFTKKIHTSFKTHALANLLVTPCLPSSYHASDMCWRSACLVPKMSLPAQQTTWTESTDVKFFSFFCHEAGDKRFFKVWQYFQRRTPGLRRDKKQWNVSDPVMF